MKISKYLNFQQVSALLKKDFLVRIRQPWMTLLQYLWPCFIFLSLYIIRIRFQPKVIEDCQYPTRQLPSNDLLPFFQSYVCTFENQCSAVDPYHETSDFEDAPVTALLKIVQIFLNEEKLYNVVVDLPKSKNFVSLVTTVAFHSRFKELETLADHLVQIFPEVQKIVGADFDIKKLFADDKTFSNSGRVLCAKPFPRSDNIRFVDNVLYSEDYNGPDTDELKAMPTPYCKQLYLDVTNTNNGKITWRHLKPIIQGKILFSPNNEATQEIVKFANKTFHDMGRLRTFFQQLDKSIKLLKTDKTFQTNFQSLRNLINSPLVKTIIGQQTNTELLDNMLKSLIEDPGVEETIQTVANIFECFLADRFIPVETEKEMEDLAYVMNQNKTFYAGVYFNNDPANDNEISYKLRMDRDNSPVTVENRNRFWFPDPEASFELDMRYHRGFIQIQNGIDTGIIKYLKKHRSPKIVESPEPVTSGSSEKDNEDDFGEDLDFDFNGESQPESEDENASTTSATTTDIYKQFADKINISDDDLKKYGDDSDLAFSDDWDFDEDTSEDTTSTRTESETTTLDPPKSRKKRQFDFFGLFLGGGAAKQQEEIKFNVDDMKFYTKQFPYPKHIKDDFKKGLYLAQAVQMSFFLALIIHVSSSVRQKIWMRESGNLSLMRTMGLHANSETVSWMIMTFFEFAVVFILAMIILYAGGILMMSSKIFIYVFLLIFGACVISFCYMASTFFSSASIGSVSAVILFLMTFLPYIIIISLGSVLSLSGKFFASLSVSTAFCYAWHQILRTELQYRSVSFENAFEGSFAENDLKFGIGMIILDIFLYAMIGYVYQKWFKVNQKFYRVERRNLDKNLGAQISNVTKIFEESETRKPAVDDVSINFKKDEILCLLGRNGAGKSTIIKMLTGQLQQTSGELSLPLDYDLITGFTIHQEQIGLCPQNNVLIPNLTAREHLELYAKFKLRSGFKSEVRRILNNLKLGKYQHYKVSELSGGYKRRLCIAIAFLGSPNLVILDEPCSGVDTKARKNIWELIETLRKGRAVVLATHYLDEAQHLGDTIVILKDGKIAFECNAKKLQDQLTRSFTLNIHFTTPLIHDQNGILAEIKKILKETVEHFDIASIADNTLSVGISYHNNQGENYDFTSLFRSLEDLKHSTKIADFQVISENLDHMFKNVEEEGQKLLTNGHHIMNNNNNNNMTTVELGKTLNGIQGHEKIEFENPSTGEMISSLLWKRWSHFRRNYRLLICILVLPVIFEVIAMGFMKIRPPGDYDLSIEFNRSLYPGTIDFYSLQNPTQFTENAYGDFERTCSVNKNCELFEDSKEVFDWVLKTNDQYLMNRYGGITLNKTKSVVWYNNKGYHSMPTYMNILNSAILKSEMNDSSYDIRTINHPMKLGDKELTVSSILQQVADAGISLILLVAFSLVLAGASVYIVNERVNGEKLQQKLCGVGFGTYWGVNYFWDMMIYCIAMFLALIVFKIFDIGIYVERDNLGGIFMLLFLFGFACIPCVHLFEKLFVDASFANMSFFCLNVVIALTTMSIIIVMDVLGDSDESEKARNFLNRLFLVFPQHALADGLIEICKNHITAQIFIRYYINSYKSPITSDLLWPHFGSLICLGIFFIFVNFIIESRIVMKILSKQPKVLKNELKMISIQNTLKKDEKTLSYAEYALKAENLYKKYNNQGYAVKNVSFKVKSGECFGLLGMNGAGKSTIFSILSGDTCQCSGNIEFSHLGYNEYGLSYCPQNNALDPLLTVTEIIHFYGRLRNIKDLKQLTETTLKSFHLEPYRNVLVKNLSGGNRRKLSVACACFGNVNLVLMDEPTSDMDPLTRSLVYKTIKELNDNSCAVILTSHSVSEIEQLCHSVGILADGKIIATGAPDILKKKFGNRYIVTLFSEQSLTQNFENDIRKNFKSIESLMCHHYSAQFVVHINYNSTKNSAIEIQQKDEQKISFSDLIEQLNKFASDKDLKYTISECLLDQVYENVISNDEKSYENNGYVQTELNN